MKFKDVKELIPKKNYVSYKLKSAVDYFMQKEGIDNDSTKSDTTRFYYNYKKLIKLSNDVPLCCTQTEVAVCEGCNKMFAKKRNHCKKKFCPICARRRSLYYLSVIMPRMISVLEDGGYINFLTLTIKDTKKLSVGLNGLMDSFRIMVHDDKFSRKMFNQMFKGGVRNIEVKKGEYSKDWHPHMHMLLVKDKFSKDYEWIKSLWENATRQAFNTKEKVGSVFIQAVRTSTGQTYKGFKAQYVNGKYIVTNDMREALTKAVVETIKYITKFNFEDYSNEDLNELIEETHGRRFMTSFGCMYGLNKDLEKEPEEVEDELLEKVCPVCGCTKFRLEQMLTENLGFIDDY